MEGYGTVTGDRMFARLESLPAIGDIAEWLIATGVSDRTASWPPG